jgi:hypothetical protein
MEVNGQFDAPIALPRERAQVTTDLEVQWAPKPVWPVLEKRKISFPQGNSNSEPSSPQLIAINFASTNIGVGITTKQCDRAVSGGTTLVIVDPYLQFINKS